jgi:hypothetical protein
MTRTRSRLSSKLADLQDSFLTILPWIQEHGRIQFRYLCCPHRKEEMIQEMVALAWRWYLRLAERGKDATRFPSALAAFAARAVRSGRRLVSQEKPKDVLSHRAQQRHGFVVGKLPDYSSLSGNPLAEALMGNTETPIPEQVSFRLDFPRWRRAYSRRDRRIIDQMMQGERTRDLARRFHISQARVSQLRRSFHADWLHFVGEPMDASS